MEELDALRLELKEWEEKYEEVKKEREAAERRLERLKSGKGKKPNDEESDDEDIFDKAPKKKKSTSRTGSQVGIHDEETAPKDAHVKEASPAAAELSTPPSRPPPTQAAKPSEAAKRPVPPVARGPSGMSLMQVPVLDRSKKELVELDDEILGKDFLKKLYLGQNSISALPERISNLSKLELLDVSFNRLTTLPNSFSSLSALGELILAGNHFERLPSSFSQLKALFKLDLTNNGLREVPREVFSLPALGTLILTRNELSSIAPEIALLKETLTVVQVRENAFKDLSWAVGLEYLEVLDAAENELTALPADIGSLRYLLELNVSSNQLKAFPASMAKLENLRKLSARRNALGSLPVFSEEEAWFSLEELDLSHNRLVELPASLCAFSAALYDLNLSNNSIAQLPDSLLALEGLSVLKLGRNRLTELPDDFGERLFNLEVLHLYYNQLSAVPSSLGGLTALVELFLAYNAISSLPEALFGPHQEVLQIVYLSGNPLRVLPASLGTCPSLRELYASGCALDLSAWDPSQLRCLEKSDLSSNALSALPATWDDALPSLVSLSLADNAALSLPALADLQWESALSLSDLNLSHCALAPPLPPSLVDLAAKLLDLANRHLEVVTFANPLDAVPAPPALHIPHYEISDTDALGFADMIGRRPSMEDAFCACQGVGRPEWAVYGLFDGHAGREAALFCGARFPRVLGEEVGKGGGGKADLLEAMRRAFPRINAEFREHLEKELPSEARHVGSTGVATLVTPEYLVTGNLGDSRSVYVGGDGTVTRLSYDHKPYNAEEQQRIRKLGGYVMGDTGRVNGLLAVSRSIGDFYMHPFVSDDPYVAVIERKKGKGEALLIACDGVWDEVSDEEAIAESCKETNLYKASARVRDLAYLYGSDDNISVMKVQLK